METPPRAWGRPAQGNVAQYTLGNTPTGVGKTFHPITATFCVQKHPHGRGEDQLFQLGFFLLQETPPRAWGRRYCCECAFRRFGNTPTGVGKTVDVCVHVTPYRKHPHGRGEDDYDDMDDLHHLETPPRAWGRLKPMLKRCALRGNTPTGVGKTESHGISRYQIRKHPPGVGKTVWKRRSEHETRKHPHGRGEDFRVASLVQAKWETPPRAWGRLATHWTPVDWLRNTPTGVGKTDVSRIQLGRGRKHPHGRGEDHTT